MAGIGFELRRMIDQRNGFVAKVRAYACAGLISSGPWLMTILTLTLINVAGPYIGGKEGYALFRALVTYAFAFSLILQGIAQMAITRRLADLLYSEQYDRVLPAFAASLLVTGALHAALGFGFCMAAGFDYALACIATTLFAIIGMTWIALIWLSVVRQFDEVLRAYIYGTLVALVGVVLLLLGGGTTGILAAYTAGQAFTLVLLIRTIMRGMETGGGREFTIFGSLSAFPKLVGVGLLYNAAIWVDKMIFWFSDGVGPHPMVRYHPLYDTCSFLAYMTVVPALAVNLIRLETSFYEHYRAYYGAILGNTPLGVIEDKRQRMFADLHESVVRLLRVQGFITVVAILFAPFIIEFLEMPPVAVRVFRLTALGAFFHVLMLITVLMQLYFDLRVQALGTSLVFFTLNGALAWWSATRGVETYGVGYALASFLSLLLGYQLLHNSLERLDYMTFTNQPIGDGESHGDDEVEAVGLEEADEAEEPEAEEEDELKVTVLPEPAAPAPVPEPVAEVEPEPVPESEIPQPEPEPELPEVLDVPEPELPEPWEDPHTATEGEFEPVTQTDPNAAERGRVVIEPEHIEGPPPASVVAEAEPGDPVAKPATEPVDEDNHGAGDPLFSEEERADETWTELSPRNESKPDKVEVRPPSDPDDTVAE